jgi:hypothetical protein
MSEIETDYVTADPPVVAKPHMTFGQIINMSFGFFGIQFGFALQNATFCRSGNR